MAYYGYGAGPISEQDGGYGYEALYSRPYYGPYFLHASDQLSGPNTSAYESTYGLAGNYGVVQQRNSYASEGSDGSIYEHDTASHGSYYSEYNSYTRYNGGAIYKKTYTLNTQSGSYEGSYSGYYGHGYVTYSYNNFTAINYTSGENHTLLDYGLQTTDYSDGTSKSFYEHNSSESYNGLTVPGSFNGYDTRSYTDSYGYTTSYTQHFT